MKSTKRSSRRRGYHHGNLSEALVQAALKLIEEFGLSGFTFADVTRAVGVSAAAPYRHFRDREALLADIARRGFEQFAAELRLAWNEGRPDPLTAFKAVGKAYLKFAHDEPAYYAAMFEAGLNTVDNRALAQTSEQAFAVLREASEKLIAEIPSTSKPPALMVSLHVWALSHGIASLFGRGDGAKRKVPMPPEDLLEAAVLVYLDGLGLNAGR
jgi:AcrR family transcriptional regulator